MSSVKRKRAGLLERELALLRLTRGRPVHECVKSSDHKTDVNSRHQHDVRSTFAVNLSSNVFTSSNQTSAAVGAFRSVCRQEGVTKSALQTKRSHGHLVGKVLPSVDTYPVTHNDWMTVM